METMYAVRHKPTGKYLMTDLNKKWFIHDRDVAILLTEVKDIADALLNHFLESEDTLYYTKSGTTGGYPLLPRPKEKDFEVVVFNPMGDYC